MTFFKNDNGDIIKYEGNDFSMSKQTFSVFDFQIKGDVSTNFTLDNTAEIRGALGYFGINASVDMAKKRIPYILVLNNSEVRGYIVIQDVLTLQIKCYFIAGNSSWFASFGFNIREIDGLNDFLSITSPFGGRWTPVTILSDWLSSFSNNLNEGIIYPFIDIYDGKKNSAIFSDAGIYSDAGYPTNQDNAVNEFYPCIFLKNVVDHAFRKAGLKIAGDMLTDVRYQNAVITPDSGDMQFDDSLVSANTVNVSSAIQGYSGGVTDPVLYTFLSGNPTMWNNTAKAPVSPGLYALTIDFEIRTSLAQIYTFSGLFNYTSQAVSTIKASVTFGQANKGLLFSPLLITGPSGFIISIATATIKIKQSIRVNDLPSPLAFLPSMKALDLLKCASTRIGCYASFDESSNTVSFNKMDTAPVVDDWSEFLIDYEYLYQGGFKNNFIRAPQPEEFNTYNLTNDAKYGEVDLVTDYEVNLSKDVYEDPFAGAIDAQNESLMKWCQPRIPLVKFTDGDGIAVSAVSDNGSGYAQLTVVSTSGINLYNVIRFDEVSSFYSGYHVVVGVTATTIDLATLFSYNSTGTVYSQSMNLNQAGSRLLLVNKGTSIFSVGDSDVSFFGGIAQGQTTFGWFSKPTTGRGVDGLKPSLSYGPINLEGYDDVPLDNGFATVKNMLNSPLVRCTFNLPESKFANFRGGKISLTCKDFTGNFWVHKILNYVDKQTPVKIDLLFA